MKWIVSCLLALLPASLTAQDAVHRQNRDFSGGLNDASPSIYLPPNESPNAKNWLIDEAPGALVKRRGYSEAWRLPSGRIPTGICNFFKSDGTEYLIIGDGPNVFQTVDFSTWTHYRTNLNSNAKINCVTINDEEWITNGVDPVFTISGTSVTNVFDGSNGRPNVPFGKYIAYEGNRVYLVRTSTAQSSVFFSLINDSLTGDPVSPSSTQAWASASLPLFCGRNDGGTIYGIGSLNGRPYVFKENSIWQINAIDDFNMGCSKTIEGAGSVANDSIIVSDGLMKFWGKDNVYEFDGVSVRPIADKIYNLRSSIRQPKLTENSKLWDTAADFSKPGTANLFAGSSLTRITTSTVVGSLVLSRQIVDDFGDGDFTSNLTWTKLSAPVGSTFSITNDNKLDIGTTIFGPPSIIGTTSTWNNGDIRFNFQTGMGGGSITRLYFLFTDFNMTGASEPDGNGYYLEFTGGSWEFWKQNAFASRSRVLVLGTFTGDVYHSIRISRVTNGDFKFYIDGGLVGSINDTAFSTAGTIMIYYRSGGGTLRATVFDDWSVNLSSGIWQSEMVNSGSKNTGWLNFTTNQNDTTPNGPPIQWGLRTANSSTTLSGYQFKALNPGVQVSTDATNTWVQLVATITVSNNDFTLSDEGPEIAQAQVSWQEGGDANELPTAFNWKRRYLVSASTAAGLNRTTSLYYTKPPITSWMPFVGLKSNGFKQFRSSIYSLDTTTNTVNLLFENNTDSTTAIDAEWQTKDETADAYDRRITLQESFVDYSKDDGASFVVSFSTFSDGTRFNDRTIGFTGTGRGYKRLFYTGDAGGSSIRMRIRDNTTNAPTKIYGLDTDILPGKIKLQ